MVIDFHMLSYQGPLQKQWSSIFHIKALYKGNGHWSFKSRPSAKAMVIDLSYQGPLQRQWSLIFHIKALCKSNGHRSFISKPSTKAMVIDLSYRGPLQKQWSSIFHIKTLFDGMVIDFLMISYQGPLQRQWSLIFHIETLCKSNGHRSFISRPFAKAMVILFLKCLHWCDFFLEPGWN